MNYKITKTIYTGFIEVKMGDGGTYEKNWRIAPE